MNRLTRILAACMAVTLMAVSAFSCGAADDEDASSKKEKKSSASQSGDEEDEEEDSEEDTEEETTKRSRRNKKDDEEETTEEEAEETTEETTEPEDPNGAPDDDPTALLPYGFFLASGVNGQFYYFFDETMSKGTFCDQETGTNNTFDYSFDGETATFYFNNQADCPQAKVTFVDDTTMTFDWDYGLTDTLEQMVGVYTGFPFYCNVELCNRALSYYEMQTGYRPGQAAATIDDDNMIVIQLYDNLGDHNSTCDWYTVDRYTAKGTNFMGEDIDLSSVPMG